MSDDDKDTSVRVAVRIRPQIPREVIDMCRVCTLVTPGEPHVVLGTDKAFTFDFVFDVNSMQPEIYTDCVERLVEGALKGYNATVLAYGQTGSGKTYTMGTGFEKEVNETVEGIIPRAVRHLFAGIERMQQNPYDENGTCLGSMQFSVAAQFMELYNEDIIDLLDPYNKGHVYKIHEDGNGEITVSGATTKAITGPQDALRCLQQGALARTTASTQMNAQSSRSHALFTILIRRQRVMSAEECGMPEGDLETLTSKFHFVDLAGSERLKRTGATGERAREGISINCGLLALGNVISALGDKTKKISHVPYRDSKLTRLLQDSLGGNSQTLMIACVSPSDRDFMETLNTLKYANRARNIKNKVQINQDQSSRTISVLRREIAALQLELLDYKQGKRNIDAEGNSAVSDTFHENAMLLADNKRLQQRLKAMQETINTLTERNVQLLAEKETLGWNSADSDKSVTDIITGYLSEIEKLKARLIESDQMYIQLKKSNTQRIIGQRGNVSYSDVILEGTESVINIAKKELEKDRELLMSRSLPGFGDDPNGQQINENENESDSDSDTESDDKGEMEAELNELSSDIELKTKLIEQLELSQQRMQIMRQHYEEKLNVLNAKIVDTQRERDQVLTNMGKNGAQQPDKIKKVRDEYERKLTDMTRELKKLHSAQKEHNRQQRELQAQEMQLRNLRSELGDLKSAKIRLMRKMTDESNRHKEAENRKAREIAQLRKESRKQQNKIKSLEAQGAAKDQVLKRKTEQVTALRKGQKSMLSTKAAGRVVPKKMPNAFNTRQIRIKWESLQRTIGRAARSKQAVMELERELERLLSDREALSKDLASLKKRQKLQPSAELISEEDTLTANLNYIQESIAQVQSSIMQLEEGKDLGNESQDISTLVEGIKTVDEARILLQKLCDNTILQTCDSALAQTRLKESEAMYDEVQQDSSIQKELLRHVLAQNPSVSFPEPTNLLTNNWNNSTNTINSNSTYDIISDGNLLDRDFGGTHSSSSSRSPSPAPPELETSSRTSKIRRRTAQTQELLFGDNPQSNGNSDNNTEQNNMTKSYTQHPEGVTVRSFIPLARVPSAPGSLKFDQLKTPHRGLSPVLSVTNTLVRQSSNNSTASPVFPRKSFDAANTAPVSPRVTRRPFPSKASPGLEDEIQVPQSPPTYRRTTSREDSDVFSRLGAGTQDPTPGGSIRELNQKPRVGIPLHCTHVVDGHTNSVLSIKVYNNTLYTAAADRTVKVWDLENGKAPHCLTSHPGPVVSVEYDSKSNLLFSASGAFIRVWDLRSSNSKAIKTLSSTGTVLAGSTNIPMTQPGESPIMALCMGASGNLYSAASDRVRIWDLRTFTCLGKLSGGHQAAVMCVTAWEGPNNTDFLATGSKDHYVKVFEVPATGGTVLPLLNLEPPHYDGVQALVVGNDALGADAELFSGSRDSGIKRWDLRNGELKQSLNNAHKSWVSGMAICGDVLLSSCRGGIIRLWNVRTCDILAEMKTDSSINGIVTNGTKVFTASNDGKVRVWRFSSAMKRQNLDIR